MSELTDAYDNLVRDMKADIKAGCVDIQQRLARINEVTTAFLDAREKPIEERLLATDSLLVAVAALVGAQANQQMHTEQFVDATAFVVGKLTEAVECRGAQLLDGLKKPPRDPADYWKGDDEGHEEN